MVVHIVVLFTLVSIANADVDPILSIQIITSSQPWSCKTDDVVLIKNTTGYLQFWTEDKNLDLKETFIPCRNAASREYLKLQLRWKQPTFRLLQINEKVAPYMHGIWKCEIRKHYCKFEIRIRDEDWWDIKINDVPLNTTLRQTRSTRIMQYDFQENELAHVECSRPREGEMSFFIPGEPFNFAVNETRSINMYMRMRSGDDRQYVECRHRKSDMDSIIKILLKRNLTNYDEVAPNVADQVVQAEECTSIDDQAPLCREKRFADKYLKELRGLRSSNITYLFEMSDNIQIHYEYEDNQTLDISWNIPVNEASKICRSSSKDNNQCKNGKQFGPTNLTEHDDLSTIKFYREENRYSNSRDVTLTLRRRNPDNSANTILSTSDPHLKFYFIVGVLICIIFFTLAFGLIYTRNKKLKINSISPNTAVDNNYEYLYEEIDIPPFPPQWETYATILERTEPDLKSIQSLYAKPVPKNERMPKIDDGYSTVVDIKNEIYHEVIQTP